MAEEKDLKDLAKARAKTRAEERMKKIGSGDFTRGFSSPKTIDNAVKTTKARVSTTKSSTSAKATGTKSTDTKATTKKSTGKTATTKSTQSKKSTKTQVGGVVVDKSAIEAPIANTPGRERRNKLIIAILAVVIVLIWVVVLIMSLVKSDPEHNCHFYLSGNASSSCETIVDKKVRSDWNTPNGIGPNTTLNNDIQLNIKKAGEYVVLFRVEVFKDKQNVSDAVAIVANKVFTIIEDDAGVSWYYYTLSTEPTKLPLMTAINFWGTLDAYKLNDITSQNIKINIYVDVYNV